MNKRKFFFKEIAFNIARPCFSQIFPPCYFFFNFEDISAKCFITHVRILLTLGLIESKMSNLHRLPK